MSTDFSFSLPKIPPQSQNDPRLEVRPSPIHGKGIFTTANIQQGEVLMIWGGELFTPEDIQTGKALEHSYTMIADGIFLGHSPEHGNTVDDYINHSCDPNVWMTNEITLTARRDIPANEEITADLAMWWEPDDVTVPPWKCLCEKPQCRKVFTSRDWRRPELYERYGDHFLPYINQKIRQFREAMKGTCTMSDANIEIIVPAATDGLQLMELAHKIELFLPNDHDIIEELWAEFAAKGDARSHYHFVVASQGDAFLGFACYGQRPLTDGTFDLYWIGVDQCQQGRGIGKAILRVVEDKVRTCNGRMLIAETEGKASFEPTRRFYLSAGYTVEARIRDFYRPNEDLFIFIKRL